MKIKANTEFIIRLLFTSIFSVILRLKEQNNRATEMAKLFSTDSQILGKRDTGETHLECPALRGTGHSVHPTINVSLSFQRISRTDLPGAVKLGC